MDIKKKLEEDRVGIQKKFEELERRRQQNLAMAQQILTEQVMLQGETRRIDKLLEEFKDEPKEVVKPVE